MIMYKQISTIAASLVLLNSTAQTRLMTERLDNLSKQLIFRIASQTKAITSVAAMMLWEEAQVYPTFSFGLVFTQEDLPASYWDLGPLYKNVIYSSF